MEAEEMQRQMMKAAQHREQALELARQDMHKEQRGYDVTADVATTLSHRLTDLCALQHPPSRAAKGAGTPGRAFPCLYFLLPPTLHPFSSSSHKTTT